MSALQEFAPMCDNTCPAQGVPAYVQRAERYVAACKQNLLGTLGKQIG